MIRATRTVSSAAASTMIPANQLQTDFNATATVVAAAGSDLTYSIEFTIDDIQDSTVTPTWCDTSVAGQAVVAGAPACVDLNINYPVTAVRLNVTAYTDGSATLTYIQASR
jgi:hypothetical protein